MSNEHALPQSSRRSWPAYLLAVPVTVITAMPFVWLLCAAFKRNEDFFTSVFLPRGEGFLGIAWDRLTLDNFGTLFAQGGFLRASLNSVLLSSVIATLATLFCAMGGYALARVPFAGRRWVQWLVLGALIIPPPLLLAPGFTVLYQLGLLDRMLGLILPAVAPAFGVYLFRQASLTSIPKELIEAARMDGCGEVRAFWHVALPLLQPMASAFMLITFLGVWNNYLTPQVVMQTPGKFPLAVAVAQLKNTYYQDYGLLMAGTLASILPVAGLFLLLQKDFIAGLTSGAVKG